MVPVRGLIWRLPARVSSIHILLIVYGHGPPKVNCWQDPLSPSKWKEEHFVIVSLVGWGLAIYGGFKLFNLPNLRDANSKGN
ncbi:hypothetical protein MKW94_018990 [Papaver nudicaule]|uniref:Uncharacterized protein n=1 Tax=Papaver nudicaule TaxID=74823 RepID=A0AA41SJZ1_PAPNU|nr:hypothetical protein [Papaver nudicaule]